MSNTSLKLAIVMTTLCLAIQEKVATAQIREKQVQCDLGETVQHAVDRARPGDVIAIFGICHEHVFVPPSKTGITITGGSVGAGIAGSVPNQAVLGIAATGVTVQGVVIRGAGAAGGSDSDFGGAGINVGDGASARIFSCLIENNRAEGIGVNSAQAVIGGNIIRNNNLLNFEGLGGVQVVFNSTAKFFDNQIEQNNRHGVIVRAQSNAFFSGGTIRNNTVPPNLAGFQADGIAVRQMSLVNLEGATVTITNNNNFGLICDGDSRFSAIPGVTIVASGNPDGDIVCTSVR